MFTAISGNFFYKSKIKAIFFIFWRQFVCPKKISFRPDGLSFWSTNGKWRVNLGKFNEKSINHSTSLVLETCWGLSCSFKIWQTFFPWRATQPPPPITSVTTIEVWRKVNSVCGFAISMFLQLIAVTDAILRYGNFFNNKGCNWVALFRSLPCILEILGNIFKGALHLVP